ncbi:MAG TPA: PQ-loop repeat-containing protein [Steroidobacteraceae bacterium]|nr:PQ-loop repeat-containing protein [Steroidobacteraceae bacterium]
MKNIVALVFGFGMLINACLFVPQAWHLWKAKRAEGVSVLSFAGFNALQLIGAVHGYFQQDTALMLGMLASLLTCGSVTLLAARYKEKEMTG